MEVVIVPRVQDAAAVVVDAIVAALHCRPAPLLGVATGSSPPPAYRLLVAAVGAGRLSFAPASAVLLDEYIELPLDHSQSYRTFIRTHLTDLVDVDLQLLGIRSDGHKGFNEPASSLQLHPHATVVIDEPAASGLRLAGYSRDVFAAKPAWQGL